MAGHSKWANIKHKKAKEDAKKGKVFTQITREIAVVAREGGGDPAGNARLRLLIDKARAANMPKENVDRAIKRGTGEIEGAIYEEHRYEGYGPGGVAVIVETLSDNKNRTIADVRHCFTKRGGNIGADGAVLWMFTHKGNIVVKKDGLTEDSALEAFLDYDVSDVVPLEDGSFLIVSALADLDKVRTHAEQEGMEVLSAEPAWMANDPVEVDDEKGESVMALVDALTDLDDVKNVYTNLA